MITKPVLPTVLAWLSRRRLRHLHALGALVGWLAYLGSPTYRRRLDAHAARAGVSVADRRRSVAEAGKMALELPRLWLRPAGQPVADPVLWHGAALVDEALARGKGLMLLTGHLGGFEVAAQAYAERWGAQTPMTALYRPARQPWLRAVMEASRQRPGLETAPATLAGVRQLMRALRAGGTLGMLPDQVPPAGMGVWAPFFGEPAYTMTLAARLAAQTGCALLLLTVERRPRGAGYELHLAPLPEPLPALQGVPDEAWLAAAAACLNRAMEWQIGRLPSQYLWGYHRFKQPRQLAAEAPSA
jgi:Kdo2-lipid IVA lauroyltransferase/acyltransferase